MEILARCTYGGCGWVATEIEHIDFDDDEDLFCPCCHRPMEDFRDAILAKPLEE